jgi:single-strand DNA-binding protein
MVVLVGRVGQPAKSGTTNSGTTWANASIATSKRKKDGTYETTWHRVVGFGKTAEEMATWQKGDGVFVEGEIQTRQYDKDGQTRTSTEVVARQVLRSNAKEQPAPEAQPEGEEHLPVF